MWKGGAIAGGIYGGLFSDDQGIWGAMKGAALGAAGGRLIEHGMGARAAGTGIKGFTSKVGGDLGTGVGMGQTLYGATPGWFQSIASGAASWGRGVYAHGRQVVDNSMKRGQIKAGQAALDIALEEKALAAARKQAGIP